MNPRINAMIGLAFRMAQDLGIHRQLGRYTSACQTGTLLDDLESRQRMSLTFTISDKSPIIILEKWKMY